MNEHLTFAKKLAEEAGVIMLKYFQAHKPGLQFKNDRSPVTEADSQINNLVIRSVKENYPGHAVLGEEASHHSDSDHVWVCDPIDGTNPYIHGIPIATFNLALVSQGQPVVAVQYDPFMKRLYTAQKGGGSYLNGRRLNMSGDFSQRLPIDLEIYNLSMFDDSQIEAEAVRALSSNDFVLFKLVAIAYGLGLTASGELAGAVFSGNHPYEAATGSLLVTEAGGVFTDIFGNPIERYDQNIKGFIAAAPLIHQAILKELLPVVQKARLNGTDQ